MSKPFQWIVKRAVIVLAFIVMATSVAMKSFVFPPSVMQGLLMLHDFAMAGASLSCMLLIATWVGAFFARNKRRGPCE